jgi:uncharacterized protein with ACT and thioredoxin-like domain
VSTTSGGILHTSGVLRPLLTELFERAGAAYAKQGRERDEEEDFLAAAFGRAVSRAGHELGKVVDRALIGLEATAAPITWTAPYQTGAKRIIVIGAGAQAGQVALGAIGEADRHNIRGERLSVDTIPVVGEENLARAVRGVAAQPRVAALVLAGSLMGGTVTEAVLELRARGILVVSLSMAGSVPDHADLVVTDPTQAGVMAVMAVASTASFDIARVRGHRY